MAEPIAIESSLGIDAPCFVRKVDRPGHWGGDANTSAKRVDDIIESVFGEEWNRFSLFKLDNVSDLRRVAIGINSRRTNLIEKLFFVAFSDHELANIPLEKTPGDSLCAYANDCHFDAQPATKEDLRYAIGLAVEGHRPLARLTKTIMRLFKERAEADGCKATGRETDCVCGKA